MGDKCPTRKSVRFASVQSNNRPEKLNDKSITIKTEESTSIKSENGISIKTKFVLPIKSEKVIITTKKTNAQSVKTEKYTSSSYDVISKTSDKALSLRSNKVTSTRSNAMMSTRSNKVMSARNNKVISTRTNKAITKKFNSKTTTKKNKDKNISKNNNNENISKTISLCENCDLNKTSINEILAKSVTDYSIVFDFLCRHGVVVKNFKCLKCGRDCHLNLTSKLFLCNKSALNSTQKKQFCNFKISVFKSTFFYKARLSYIKVFEFVYLYLRYPVKGRSHVIIKELGIGPNTFTDWANFVREVLMHYSRHHSQPIGGPNIIVEIEEAKFGAHKCNRFGGIPDQWIIAGVERDNMANQFIIVMPQNDIQTLNKILKQYIRPESIVHSSIMESLKNLKNEEFHLAIDHKINLVCSGTDSHTQSIKDLLRDLRNNIPEFGQKGEHFNGYLAEARFRLLFPKPGERFHHFWRATGDMFPPMV